MCIISASTSLKQSVRAPEDAAFCYHFSHTQIAHLWAKAVFTKSAISPTFYTLCGWKPDLPNFLAKLFFTSSFWGKSRHPLWESKLNHIPPHEFSTEFLNMFLLWKLLTARWYKKQEEKWLTFIFQVQFSSIVAEEKMFSHTQQILQGVIHT